ncbi:cGMP-dependent protein kinase 1-like [Homarus americanus]|uniref:cGMP-dependent protein kinase 1-like n=1 Tax=Homarus americanus TaxID=6706 RepID=UPI001C43EA0C|nr:cGMP-dependent protein kinase 1-like [Homarus americanus]
MSLLLNGVNQCISSMGSLEVQELLGKKDDLIRDLEEKLKVRENEITELRSQLDKFQSVIPFATVGPTPGSPKGRARKTRAQGISAEPQTLKTVQELADLSQTTFPEVPKTQR